MKQFKVADSQNPVFNTVTGLINTTYNNSNIRSGQMATEDQILVLHQDAAALQSRINYCCRDIVIWKTYLRIVEEKTGIVVSDFFDNMATGTTRRGVPFTVEFARVFDTDKFIMDRSASDRVGNNKKNFRINTVGINSTSGGTKCFEDGMIAGMNDFYENTRVYGSSVSGLFPGNACSTSDNQNSRTVIIEPIPDGYSSESESFLPQRVVARDNIYYVYLDPSDNKIKIDILGKNQFYYANDRVNAYDTAFFTQWVLKDGATL